MKKLLIATSAVVGLGVVSADFAAAQLETSFSGHVRVRLAKGVQTTEGMATGARAAVAATPPVAATPNTLTAATFAAFNGANGTAIAAGSTIYDASTGLTHTIGANPANANSLNLTLAAGDTITGPATPGTAAVAAVAGNHAAEPRLYLDRTQLQWDATGTTDSGLTYGAQLRFRPDAGGKGKTGSNKGNIHFGGGFGKITLGNMGRVIGHGDGAAVGGGTGGVDGAYGVTGGTNPRDGMVDMKFAAPYMGGDSGDINGLGYTGTFSGVTLVGYYQTGNGVKNDGDGDGSLGVAVSYGGSFGDGSFSVGASYTRGNTESTVNSAGVVAASGTHDAKVMTFGANAGFGPVTVGMTYVSAGKSGAAKNSTTRDTLKGGQKYMAVAAKYNFGPGNVAVTYARAEADVHNTATTSWTDSRKAMSLGADYTIAPGWAVAAEVYRFNNKTGQTGGNADDTASSTAWVLQSQVSF